MIGMSNATYTRACPSQSLTIERLFRTTISTSQHNTISQFLIDAETEMRHYQNEIDNFKSKIVLRENKRSHLSKKMAKYRSLLSPVHKMPPEVLGNVFAFACEEQTVSFRPDHIPQPLLLSAVCGRWREVAVATPFLWTSININFAAWEKVEHYRHLLQQTQLFLERSKISPLHIYLNFNYKLPRDDAVSTLTVLVSHSNRWQRLILAGVTQDCLRQAVFSPLEQYGLPMLVHLDVSGLTDQDTEDADFVCQLFAHCPSLTSLRMKNDEVNPVRTSLPWQQIKMLETYFMYESGLNLVPRCPNLERLALYCVGGVSEDPIPVTHVISPVQRLSIDAQAEDDATCIFMNSTLRELSSIEIRGIDENSGPWTNLQTAFADFLARSSCSLTSITLDRLPITDTQATRLLQLLPTLTTLHIGECRSATTNRIITTTFLDRFSDITEMSTAPFLPQLAHVKFVLHAEGLDVGVLSRALTSRWVPDTEYALTLGIACTQSIDIVFVKEGSHIENVRSSLEWMVGAGARLTVSKLHE
ncbi:hypothetical protein VNI00_005997 [Paramarasmius palmivorus]|uniref:F-box domain-containing protein n=1 Tax=Paramarasmius palmivorus TaxID=297713 RepID=A0AAW0DGY4_9AGAR